MLGCFAPYEPRPGDLAIEPNHREYALTSPAQ